MPGPGDLDVDTAARTLVLVLDLLGTFVFAVSGAMTGVWRRLDFFGILVLAFAAATAGGILRDLLIGAVPPAAIHDWRYVTVSLVAGIATFFWHRTIERLRNAALLFDALGLAVFAVSGTAKALAFGLHPVMAALLGTLTGIGGGVVRDLLVTEVPIVLRSEIYAVAALAGSAIVALGHEIDVPASVVSVTAAALCFGIRMFALHRDWHLPVPPAQAGS